MHRTHAFGDLLSKLRARKHGLTQAKLAAMAGYDPAVVARMARGQQDLTGTQARERVLRLIYALDEAGVLYAPEEANALLDAAALPPLYAGNSVEAALLNRLELHRRTTGDELQSEPRHNLPAQVTRFVGREHEIEHIGQFFAGARLVTLTGPGGVGKTRLAIEAAAQVLDRFPDGVWWVSFASLSDPSRIAEALLDVWQLKSQDAAPLHALVEFLQKRRLLLLLDNCEHLVDACADLVAHVLSRCPCVSILATSREGLQVPGELALRVPPLSVPPTSAVEWRDVLQFDAVKLFVERAQAIRPDFELTPANAQPVAYVCDRLDGLPLALELAAALLQAMSLEEIAARIDNRFALLNRGYRAVPVRHQALSNAVDWSYELLPPVEQVLLARLSVFAGAWQVDAAESICADASSTSVLQRADVLPALRQLVNKSLVAIDGRLAESTRYRLLKTIHEYAVHKLRERGEQKIMQDNHLDYMVRLAESTDAELRQSSQQHHHDAWDRLMSQQDELRAALAFAEQQGNADMLLRLAAALQLFWRGRGQRAESTAWMNKALAVGKAAPARLRAAVMYAWAWTYADDADALKQLAPEAAACLEDCRAAHDDTGIAQAQTVLGGIDVAHGRYADARRHFDEALGIFEKLGDKHAVWNVRHRIGNALQHEDDAAAQAWMQESIRQYTASGDAQFLSTTLADLAWLLEGNHPDDPQLLDVWHRAVEAARQSGDIGLQSEFLYMLGHAEVRAGDRAQAGAHFAQSLEIACDMDSPVGIEHVVRAMRDVDPARAEAILTSYLLRKQQAADQDGIASAQRFLALVRRDG